MHGITFALVVALSVFIVHAAAQEEEGVRFEIEADAASLLLLDEETDGNMTMTSGFSGVLTLTSPTVTEIYTYYDRFGTYAQRERHTHIHTYIERDFE